MNNVKRKELLDELKRDKHLEFLEVQRDTIEKKSIAKRFDRCLNLQRKEYELEREEHQKKENALIKESKANRDEKLAFELRQVKEKDMLELQRRFYIYFI